MIFKVDNFVFNKFLNYDYYISTTIFVAEIFKKITTNRPPNYKFLATPLSTKFSYKLLIKALFFFFALTICKLSIELHNQMN